LEFNRRQVDLDDEGQIRRILASSAAVSFVRAKVTGHIVPSSRFALSLKPNVAYLA
jgi:hypothetical protein